MRNIELKAHLRDRVRALDTCHLLDALSQGDIHQLDTYFQVRTGRLKLREVDTGKDELVFYRRPDVAGPKGCDYLVDPVHRSIKPLLTESFGVVAVVDKLRTLFLWENVRIHLDRVKGLGDFIEFEAVLSDDHDEEDGRRKLGFLIERFALEKADHCINSYLEMVADLEK